MERKILCMAAVCMAAVCMAAGSWMPPAAAQTIYRCGDSYSQQRCPGGTPVQADDPRSASQRTQTLEAVQRDAKTAEAMEKARIKEEAKPAQAAAPPAKVEEVPPEERKVVEAKPRKSPYFTAVSPKAVKKKKAKKKKAA